MCSPFIFQHKAELCNRRQRSVQRYIQAALQAVTIYIGELFYLQKELFFCPSSLEMYTVLLHSTALFGREGDLIFFVAIQ